MVIFGLIKATVVGDTIRLRILEMKQTDYIDASHSLGLPERVIIFKHILQKGCASLMAMSFCQGLRDAIIIDFSLAALDLSIPHDLSLGGLAYQVFIKSPVLIDSSAPVIHWVSILVVTALVMITLTVVSNDLGRNSQRSGAHHG